VPLFSCLVDLVYALGFELPACTGLAANNVSSCELLPFAHIELYNDIEFLLLHLVVTTAACVVVFSSPCSLFESDA
jgi:hypothetical protein